MPRLKNLKHEKFAQLIASGKTLSDSYLEAGFLAKGRGAQVNNGSRLRNRPDVSARIEELVIQGARKAQVGAADVIQMLLEDRKLARELGQAGPAIRADELLGKAAGLFIDRRELRISVLDDLSPDQLDALRRAAIAEEMRRRGELGAAPAVRVIEAPPKMIEYARIDDDSERDS